MNNRKIVEKTTKQIAIDMGLHKLLKIRAAKQGESIKELIEGVLAEYLAVDKEEE